MFNYDSKLKQIYKNSRFGKSFIKSISYIAPGIFLQWYLRAESDNDEILGRNKSVVTISFDCDLPENMAAIPVIVKQLSNYKFKTSFACIGMWIEKYVDLHLRLLDEGHEIINHTYSHPNNEIFNPNIKFNEISYEERKQEIIRCHEVINKYLNYNPIGFRVPHFGNLFVDDIYPLLSEIGYKYSSSTLALNTKYFGQPYIADNNIVEFPLSPCPRHPFTSLDSYHFYRSNNPIYKINHREGDAFYTCFKTLLKLSKQNLSYLNLYFDPMDIINNKYYTAILDLISEEDVEVLNYAQIIKNNYSL